MIGEEFTHEMRRMTLPKETLAQLSNRALYALAVDAVHEVSKWPKTSVT